MARELRTFQFTIPAGTAKAAPFTQQLSFPPRIVVEIDIRVPPGPAGTMGLAIGSSGNPVIPIEPGTWIVADDEYIRWPIHDFWDSGSWELFGYNLGQFDHTVYLTFLCDLVPSASSTPSAPIPSSALSSAVSVGSGSTTTTAPPATGTTGGLSTLPAPPGLAPVTEAGPQPGTVTAPPVIAPSPQGPTLPPPPV